MQKRAQRWAAAVALAVGVAVIPAGIAAAGDTTVTPAGDVGWGNPPAKPSPTPTPTPTVGTNGDVGWG
ncbi:hypothetical protein [Streptomyces sp. NPDC088925]|uniref:hypothetical protein n=1 Tax=Streptomyces sp. NPDC088925 TaxID=3365914 RepID=UPI00380386B6